MSEYNKVERDEINNLISEIPELLQCLRLINYIKSYPGVDYIEYNPSDDKEEGIKKIFN